MKPRFNRQMAHVLQTARLARGWTQEHLAGASGVSVQTVKRAEGAGTVSQATLTVLCDALGLSVDNLAQQAAGAAEATSGYRYLRLEIREKVNIADFLVGLAGTLGCLAMALGFPAAVAMLIKHGRSEDLTGVAFAVVMLALAIVSVFVSAMAMNRLPFGGPMGINQSSVVVARGHDAPHAMDRALALSVAAQLVLFLAAYAQASAPVVDWLYIGAAAALGIGQAIGHRHAVRQHRRALAARRAAYAARVPAIIADLRTLIASPLGPDGLARAEALLREARDLADAANRSFTVRPLEYLLEDVARGLSARAALPEYLDVAQRLVQADLTVPRLREDALAIDEELFGRVSVFA